VLLTGVVVGHDVRVNQKRRRSAFAYAVTLRRGADYTHRASVVRAACIVAIASGIVFGASRWWCWLLVAPAALGTWQVLSLSKHLLQGTEPRNPLVRWAYDSGEGELGRTSVNVSGVFEGVGCLPLAFVGPWGIQELPMRVIAVAAAVTYAGSTFSAVFTDPAFYNPDEVPPAWMELARSWCGPLLALLSLAILIPAQWPGTWLVGVLLLGAANVAVLVRVRETDRGLAFATQQSVKSEMHGRDLVLAQAHAMLAGTLGVAVMYAARSQASDPETYDAIRLARARLQRLTILEDAEVDDAQLPGSLARPVEWLARPYGVHTDIDIQVSSMAHRDHDMATLVLSDLVGNAVKASASRVRVVLLRADQLLEVSVSDDAAPFADNVWRARHSSLDRLGRILENAGGGLTHTSLSNGKTITATWPEQDTGTELR
jgi:hypothetical protein